MTIHSNSGKPRTGNPEPSLRNEEGVETMAKASRPQVGSKRVAPRTGEEIVRSRQECRAVVRCNKCLKVKPASEFYPPNKVCKDCYKKRVAGWQKTERGKEIHNKANAKYRERHSNFNIEVKKAFKKSPAGKEAERRYYQSKMERIPEKMRARAAAQKLVSPEQCSRCGKTGKVQRHHPDYSKPLEVEWLCLDCHRIADAE